MQTIDTFYELARQHKLIKSFKYGKPGEKGAGSDIYPLVWLDDPISGQSMNGPRVLRHAANVDILGIPANDAEVATVQTTAFLVGLSFIEQFKNVNAGLSSIESFSYITLREYYDDLAAGVRFSFVLTGANPINICGDFFDPTKVFEIAQLLPNFNTDNPDGCAVFNDKPTLPNFTI